MRPYSPAGSRSEYLARSSDMGGRETSDRLERFISLDPLFGLERFSCLLEELPACTHLLVEVLACSHTVHGGLVWAGSESLPLHLLHSDLCLWSFSSPPQVVALRHGRHCCSLCSPRHKQASSKVCRRCLGFGSSRNPDPVLSTCGRSRAPESEAQATFSNPSWR